MRRSLVIFLILTFSLSTIFPGNTWSADFKEKELKEIQWQKRSDRAETWLFEDLPRHIGNDFKETFWNKWHLLAIAGGTGIILGIHTQDTQIRNSFQPGRPMGKTFDDVMNIGFHPLVLGGTLLLTYGVSEIFRPRPAEPDLRARNQGANPDSPPEPPIGVTSPGEKLRIVQSGWEKVPITAGTLLEALILTETLTLGLQLATRRARPDGSKDSFPSGHTSGAFALAAVTETLYGPWIGVPSFALASLVGLARIDSDKHWTTDVLAGALLGTLMGLGTAEFHKKEFANYFLTPTVGEGSAGLCLIHPF